MTTEGVTDTLAMAADARYEVGDGFTFPGLYAALASAHFTEYGSNWEQLAAITIKNHHNSSLNPKAHFQREVMDIALRQGKRKQMTFNDELDFLKSSLNPYVAYPIRLFDCCPISDGASVLILAVGEKAREFTDSPVYIRGIGQASDAMALHDRESLTSLRAQRVWREDVVRLDFEVEGGDEDIYVYVERAHFYIATRVEFGASARVLTATVQDEFDQRVG